VCLLSAHSLALPALALDGILSSLPFMQITAGISNSFGFGGHNSVCVFAPFKA
jgi:3-oxoacyl-[acyl-carrier-protein] synthase II